MRKRGGIQISVETYGNKIKMSALHFYAVVAFLLGNDRFPVHHIFRRLNFEPATIFKYCLLP